MSLTPARWEQIQRLADAQDIFASEVVEAALDLYFSSLANSRKSVESFRNSDQTVEVA